MGAKKYDFSGWASRNDLECSDGRIIRQGAFKDCDGMTVPMVWMHSHDNPENVLGHCILRNEPEGIRAYGFFNDTENGRAAKEQVRNGDIDSLSIWANHLKQTGNGDGSVNVTHGEIKEVSLVLSGANPGAKIDTIMMHSGEESEDDLIIFSGTELTGEGVLAHADTDSDGDDSANSSGDVNTNEGENDMGSENEERTVQDVFDEMTDEQKDAVYFMLGEAMDENGSDEDDYEDEEDYDDEEYDDVAEQADYDGEEDMKYNVFDNSMDNRTTLSHDDMEAIFKDAKVMGSLKESFLAHTSEWDEDPSDVVIEPGEYGIHNIDYLFPDAKAAGDYPSLVSRDMAWVSTVMNGCHHTPFSRIKTMAANITNEEARALGYMKGNLKKEEVFSLLKRTTDPQTIYKKQKLDRDDMIDITDFDVVAFLKTEMRTMLDEEIARAVLVGDGRIPGGDDKISEDHIRPIYKDADFYSIKKTINVPANATGADKAKEFIDEAVRARKDYKGSGSPTCFMTEDMLTECLLLEDGINHKLYADEAAVARAIRCEKIVTVPVMENLTDATYGDLAAIIVNLRDYNIGADKGGAISMFDDFDIDYNQMKYLIETRCSGALIKPYSAIVLSVKEAA